MADISLSILDQIEIASPCPVLWQDMDGDDRTRFCRECSLHVHNISGMTRDEAERFLQESLCTPNRDGSAKRLCGIFYRRADGTILTQDCPVGLAAIRDKARRALSRTLAGIIVAGTSAIAWATGSYSEVEVRRLQPFASLIAWLSPPKPSVSTGGVVAISPARMQQINAAAAALKGNSCDSTPSPDTEGH